MPILVALLALAPLGARAGHPGDRAGVEPETLTIGLHVPFTGSSPLPAHAVVAGASLYWTHLHDDLGILVNGRRVAVQILDDRGSPSTAAWACNKLSGSSFLLLGYAGAEQIAACAWYADQHQVPYLTPGLHRRGLASRETYYALSPSWVAIAPMMAEFVANRLLEEVDRYGVKRFLTVPVLGNELPVVTSEEPDGVAHVGLVRSDAATHDGLETRLRTELGSVGHRLTVYRVTGTGFVGEAQRIAQEMQDERIEVAVAATAPIFTTQLTRHLDSAGYAPRFLTMGTTSGVNAVAGISCAQGSAFHKASSFSPWPGWAEVMDGDFDPAFVAAVSAHAADENTPDRGDHLLALWGLMKDVHAMLEAAGPDPTRQDFNAMIDSGFSASTGVYPPLAFSADDPFGADAIHRLEVDCETDNTFHQADAFVTGYPAG